MSSYSIVRRASWLPLFAVVLSLGIGCSETSQTAPLPGGTMPPPAPADAAKASAPAAGVSNKAQDSAQGGTPASGIAK